MALLMLGRYAEALVALPQVPILFWFIHGALAICHARLGQPVQAKAEIDSLLAQKPGITIHQCFLFEDFQRDEDLNFLAEGLRLAGLSE